MNAYRHMLSGSLISLGVLIATGGPTAVVAQSVIVDTRLVDLLRDEDSLRRIRRVHHAFGEALRDEQMSRDVNFLDVDER